MLAVSSAAVPLWQWHRRTRKHADERKKAALSREWRRRRLEVSLGAARADRHDALAAQQAALDRAVDLRKRLHTTTKGAGLTVGGHARRAVRVETSTPAVAPRGDPSVSTFANRLKTKHAAGFSTFRKKSQESSCVQRVTTRTSYQCNRRVTTLTSTVALRRINPHVEPVYLYVFVPGSTVEQLGVTAGVHRTAE